MTALARIPKREEKIVPTAEAQEAFYTAECADSFVHATDENYTSEATAIAREQEGATRERMHRSRIAKVIIWRMISVTITMIIIYVATGSFSKSTGVTACLHGILVFCHYQFESFWEKINENHKEKD